MTLLDTILTIAAGLFGGLNALQLVFLRQTRRRYRAEADSAAAGAEREKSDWRKNRYDYIMGKLSEYQRMYYELNDRVMDDAKRYSRQIAEHLNEIAALKTQVLYWRGVSCRVFDCPQRVPAVEPDTGRDETEESGPRESGPQESM